MAVFDLHAEQPTEISGQFVDCGFTVVDAAHLVQCIDNFYQFDEAARPAERRSVNIGFWGG